MAHRQRNSRIEVGRIRLEEERVEAGNIRGKIEQSALEVRLAFDYLIIKACSLIN